MSKISMANKQEQKLRLVEGEFREVLVRALKNCRDGGQGLFLTSEEAKRRGWSRFVWADTKKLEQLGQEITELRSSLGLPIDESLWNLFLKYSRITGPNAPGASKLAAALLAELEPAASS